MSSNVLKTPGNKAGNLSLLKGSLNEFVALGHKQKSDDFVLVMEGFEHIKSLVQAFQIPAVSRGVIELFAPHGVKFQQQGSPQTAGEMPITFVETVHGHVYKKLRDSTAERGYFNLELTLSCEELPASSKPLRFKLYNCWISLDGGDLDTSDENTPLKPSGTLYYNWFEYPDD